MKVIIIGNGIAGSSAARFIRKFSEHDVMMISGESDYPFSRTALMYVYMGHVRFRETKLYEDWFWEKNRIQRLRATVTAIDTAAKKLMLDNQTTLQYDVLIIASGSKSNKFGWNGQDLEGVRGLYHLQDLEYIAQRSAGMKRAVIVGGGLIGIELAEMFHARQIPVTMLVRERSFWNMVLPPEESAMVNRHIREHGIDLRLSTELAEITDRGDGTVSGIITNAGERIDCDFAGITAGVSPNIDFLKNSGIEMGKGALVNDFLETNIRDVYAIGDCAELRQPRPGRRPTEAVWYTGRMMGQTVAYTICGKPVAYDPGIWFNSAKFFDIEYSVYGQINSRPDETIANIYWEHTGGKKSIRIAYEKATGIVTGFNLMGIRFRHEVCEKWIKERTPVDTVLAQLRMANFDPEFFKTYERVVQEESLKVSGSQSPGV
jgi:NADPH-dependent 2,4-dienoyl-CoA reductase/sulfur reductase-like enzyme